MIQNVLGRRRLWVSDRRKSMRRGLEVRENMGRALKTCKYGWEYHLSVLTPSPPIPEVLLLESVTKSGRLHEACGSSLLIRALDASLMILQEGKDT